MRTLKRIPRSLVIGGILLAAGAALATLLRGNAPPQETSAPPTEQVARPAPVEGPATPPPEAVAEPAPPPAPAGPVDIERVRLMLDPGQAVAEDGKMVQHLPDGSTAVLSLRPDVQQAILDLFEKYDVPVAAAVAIEVETGRVVVFAGRSRAPVERPVPLDASFPAASVFKLVTGAALVEDAKVPATESMCYRTASGTRKLTDKDIEEAFVEGAEGVTCATLSDGLARSLNPVLARLADAHLSPRVLLRYAERFAFGRAIPFDLPLDVSPVEIPQDRDEFARTAAGFWHVGLSPLHGALLAATVARGGRMPQPTLIDAVLDSAGNEVWRVEPRSLRRVISEQTAQLLTTMMIQTVDSGTGKRDFTDPKGLPFLSVPVAGKTGSLSNPSPFMAYSWFVGFAPAGPAAAGSTSYAVGALVVNEERWRIKGPLVAREMLRLLLGS
jgi:peptidoglycan glycosyltransferase